MLGVNEPFKLPKMNAIAVRYSASRPDAEMAVPRLGDKAAKKMINSLAET